MQQLVCDKQVPRCPSVLPFCMSLARVAVEGPFPWHTFMPSLLIAKLCLSEDGDLHCKVKHEHRCLPKDSHTSTMRPLRELATSPAGQSVAKPAAKAGGKALAGDTAQDEGMELWGTDSSWAGSLDCAGLLLGDSKAALQIPVRGGVVPPELVAFESVTVAVEVRAGCIKRSLITGVCRMHAQG